MFACRRARTRGTAVVKELVTDVLKYVRFAVVVVVSATNSVEKLNAAVVRFPSAMMVLFSKTSSLFRYSFVFPKFSILKSKKHFQMFVLLLKVNFFNRLIAKISLKWMLKQAEDISADQNVKHEKRRNKESLNLTLLCCQTYFCVLRSIILRYFRVKFSPVHIFFFVKNVSLFLAL